MLAGSLDAGAPQGPLDARALAIASVAAVAITLMLLMLPWAGYTIAVLALGDRISAGG